MITFTNPGILDIRSITTFGTSSKKTPSSAIGYFGTGLKYAIAISLREKATITIASGNALYTFYSERETLRNDEFDFIYMNTAYADGSTPPPPLRLAFTTELGKDWPTWNAFRELYSNMLDEDGEAYGPEEKHPTHDPDSTTITIDSPIFDLIWAKKSSYFLSTEPLTIAENVEIHPGRSAALFYKGVKVYDLDLPSSLTYNITSSLSLTENRTIAYTYDARRQVASALLSLNDPDLLRTALCRKDSFEADLDWDIYTPPSATWIDLISGWRKANSSLATPSMLAKLHNHAPEAKTYTDFTLSKVESSMLERAKAFHSKMNLARDYPIRCVIDLGPGVYALAENETIYISRECFKHGTSYVLHALIEETFHLETGYHDLTREFQTHIFKNLIAVGEELMGEAV